MRGKQVHLAILGACGIPAQHGGFQTFAEELESVMLKEAQAEFYLLTPRRIIVYFKI